MKKQWIATLLSVFLISGFYGTGLAAKDVWFTDVAPDFWGYHAIQWGYDNKIIEGYPDGSFKPNNPVSQDEFLAMVLRAYKPVDLADNNAGGWFLPYREYESKMNWNFTVTPPPLRGYAKSQPTVIYPPRWKVAQLLTRMNGRNYNTEDSIKYILDVGLAEGKTTSDLDGFKMSDTITRAEAVTLIQRLKSKLDVLYQSPYEITPYDPGTVNRTPAENWQLRVLKDGEGHPLFLHSVLQFETPASGYTQTKDSRFEVSGEIVKSNNDRLYLQIDKKKENGFVRSDEVQLSFDNHTFKLPIIFAEGKGLYRISVISAAQNNEQTNVQRITMFYIESL